MFYGRNDYFIEIILWFILKLNLHLRLGAARPQNSISAKVNYNIEE